ncbi:MAG: hypothetical protein Q9159_003426 [Coniocarpon cinnabarinum]
MASRSASLLRGRASVTSLLAHPGPVKHVRKLHVSSILQKVQPYLLADIGEGIREVEIIQWFVKPGARVEQFQKICEVQSDKAITEISSRFDGIIQKLHYEANEMAQVGRPLVDIDIQSELSPEDEAYTTPPEEQAKATQVPRSQDAPNEDATAEGQPARPDESEAELMEARLDTMSSSTRSNNPSKHRTLATPAVRHLTKTLGIEIVNVQGTGKEGRVLKEDVLNHQKRQSEGSTSTVPFKLTQEDKTMPLTPIQNQMFKSMTKSLHIPHFLYTDSLDFGNLNRVRKSFEQQSGVPKSSALAFIVKAVSIAMSKFPVLNARLDVADQSKPQLHYRVHHNIGIAVDTPQGLLVPVIKSVQTLSIPEIAAEISRLGSSGREGKLTGSDLSGGTITVSNVGSIGGGVVSPVIVEGQSAIIGVGKAKLVPAFDDAGNVIRREECILSWSADHRFVDGASVARAAEVVKHNLEQPANMIMSLR